MGIVFYLIFGLVMGAIFTAVCSSMAKKRNRDSALWGVFGFFAGFIGGFILGFIPVILLAILGNDERMVTQHAGNATPLPASQPVKSETDKYKELEALSKLREQDIITDEEFENEKKKLLA